MAAKRMTGVPLGRLAETIAALPDPDRWAKRAGPGIFSDYTLQRWTNRAALARSIRMQERGPSNSMHWTPIVPLSPGEGF